MSQQARHDEQVSRRRFGEAVGVESWSLYPGQADAKSFQET